MDLKTFLHDAGSIVDVLEPAMNPSSVRSIRSCFEHGEEGIGLDELLATLINREVPVSPSQREKLRELVDYFDLGERAQHRLPHVRAESVDRLQVVDD